MLSSSTRVNPSLGPATPPASSAQSSSTITALKAYSCILCSQRKVKCDKNDPCSNCRRKGVVCVFRAPAPPRRRRRRSPEAALLLRLKRAEDLLQSHGVTIDARDDESHLGDSHSDNMVDVIISVEGRDDTGHNDKTPGRSMAAENGRLIGKEGKTRYLENNLWKNLDDESIKLQDPKDLFHVSSEDEAMESSNQQASFTSRPAGGDLMFGSRLMKPSKWRHHPETMHIMALWQTYLENVNPLTKILHTPTMQKQIIDASGDLDNVSKAFEALMFAIYSSAVNSMTEEECQRVLGEARLALLDRYTYATHQALLRVKFLKTTDIVVLQAFVLFLLVMRTLYDPGTLWVICGVAVRIGQRLGLHRDGVSLGLPVFETEMRRRLSWLLGVLDGRSAQAAGQGTSAMHYGWDVRLPSNVNDSDLYPQMKEPPVESTGATEMIFCLIRYNVGRHFERARMLTVFDGNWRQRSDGSPILDKDKQIDDLEDLLESKFIRYCDPIIPLHLLAASVARSTVYSLRVMAHHPLQQPDGGTHMPQAERDGLFDNCLKLIEYANAVSMKSLQPYLWHIRTHFQWHAVIYLLGELRFRPVGDQVDRAWRQVEEVFEHYPAMITDRKGGFHAAVGHLTIRAWEVREVELARQQPWVVQSTRPNFINKLYSQWKPDTTTSLQKGVITSGQEGKPDEQGPQNDMTPGGTMTSINILNDSGGIDSSFLSDSAPLDLSPIDWAVWDDVIKDFELQQEAAIEDELFT
ncbi:hypothetical protein MMC11_001863 [Xylographa trunciseda]|nr:hypothetical protein [Xylographa trunciseda]